MLFCIFVAMQKRFFFLFFVCSLMGGVSAHEFYFAYAELSYNEFTNNLEGTLIFSTHDLEKAIEPNGSLIGLFDKLDVSSPTTRLIEAYLNEHFKLSYGCALDSNAVDVFCMSSFTLEGLVTQLNGTIECYISMPVNAIYAPVYCQFNALMEQFPLQQNKLTFTYRQHKETVNFIAIDTQHTLKLQ